MPHCSAYGCYNTTARDSRLSFFKFPLHCPAELKQWIHNCGRAGWKPSKYSTLCSAHFEENCIEVDMYLQMMGQDPKKRRRRRTLKSGAIPTIFSHGPQPSKPRLSSVKRAERSAHKKAISQLLSAPALSPVPVPVRSTKKESTALHTKSKIPRKRVGPAPTSTITSSSEYTPLGTIEEEIPGFPPSEPISPVTRPHTPSPTKIARYGTYGTPRRTRLDHPYFASRTKDTATQTEKRHVRIESSTDSSLTPPHALPLITQPSDQDDSPFVESGSSYKPSPSTSTDTDSTSGSPANYTNKYVVFRDQLDSLLNFCIKCGKPITKKVRFTTGSMLSVKMECHGGHDYTWQSQPVVNRTPMGNILMSAAILFAGLTHAAVAEMAACLGLLFFSQPVFDRYQKEVLFPVVQEAWELEREGTALEVKDGGPATLAGDARCDTPGHNAKYGSYALMHVDGEGRHGINRIVALELVQVSEVKNSNHMEAEGLRRCLRQVVTDDDMDVTTLATDRHLMIGKMMREDYPELDHQLDVWHVGKGINRKLAAKARGKGCEDLLPWIQSVSNHLWWCCATSNGDAQLLKEQWLSILHHIVGIHNWTGNVKYHKCGHTPIDEEEDMTMYLEQTSPAFSALKSVVTARHLLKALPQLTKYCHTGQLEVYHSFLLKYCPKRQHFFYEGMKARLMLSALAWNYRPRPNPEEPAATDSIYSKRRGRWVARKRSQRVHVQKRAHLPMLMARVTDVVTGKVTLPPIVVPAGVAILGADVPRPTKGDLLAAKVTRFVH